MSEKNMMLLVLVVGGYVLFVHKGGLLSGATASADDPPPNMPADGNTAAIANTIQSGFDLVRSIFEKASGNATGTRGSGVSNV
jgi:hypothetical protein